MTEWWVSQKKHWCTICRVWTGGHPRQISKHTEGRMHQEHEVQMLKDARARETKKQKDETDLTNELARIERAAATAMAMSAQPAVTATAPSAAAIAATQRERGAEKRKIQETIEAAQAAKQARAAAGSEPAPGTCAWTRHTDPGSGHYYWHNASTAESSWTEPAEYAAAVRSAAATNPAPIATREEAVAAIRSATAANPAPIAAREEVKPAPAGIVPEVKAAPAGNTHFTNPPLVAAQASSTPARGSEAPAATATSSAPPTAVDPRAGPGAVIFDWVVCTDPGSGRVYYYNRVTGVSSWEKPPDLGVDLSKPPGPPTARKPPPPPERKKKSAKQDAMPGAWEVVAPEESQFHRPDEEKQDESDEEETPHQQLLSAKWELRGRKGEWAPEDRELREKEMFTKTSSAAVDADEEAPMAMPAFKIKKAAGIRRRAE